MLALLLAHVAVHRRRLHVVADEAGGEPVGAALRAHEDEGEAALGVEQLDELVDLVGPVTETKMWSISPDSRADGSSASMRTGICV